MAENRQYDHEYKVQAVKLAKEIGQAKAYPDIRGAIIHSDRGTQYTSQAYRDMIRQYGIQQSMNRAEGR